MLIAAAVAIGGISWRVATVQSSGGALAVTAAESEILALEQLAELSAAAAVEVADDVDIVQRYGFDNSSTFAGAFGSGAVIYAGFTSDWDSHLLRLRTVVSKTTVRVFVAKHTQEELIEAVQTISADRSSLRAEGILIRSIGVDPKRNRLRITFGEVPRPEWLDTLTRRYGDDLLWFDELPKTFFVT